VTPPLNLFPHLLPSRSPHIQHARMHTAFTQPIDYLGGGPHSMHEIEMQVGSPVSYQTKGR